MSWIDPYMGRRYEAGWISTNFYYYDRKSGKPAEHDAWNKLVSALGDIQREDHQYGVARKIVGVKRYGRGEIDPETGESQFIVGMCLLAAHLTSKGYPAKLERSWAVHLMFQEEPCTGPKRHEYCQGIVKEVRDLHAKLSAEPHTIKDDAEGRLGIYR